MRKNYTSVPIWMIVGLALSGAVLAIVSIFLEDLMGAVVGMTCLLAGLALTFASKDWGHYPEPALYRYDVVIEGGYSATVYAADVDTDTVSAQTAHFSDHEGNTIAIYSHVCRIVATKVLTEED